MTDKKRMLVDKYWAHMQMKQRAWVSMVNASHQLIGERDPERIERLGMASTLAADAMIAAEHAADLIKQEINEIDRGVPLETRLVLDPAMMAALIAAAKEGR